MQCMETGQLKTSAAFTFLTVLLLWKGEEIWEYA